MQKNLLVCTLTEEPEERMLLVDFVEAISLGLGSINIGANLSRGVKEEVIQVLKKNHAKFVWEGEMPTQVPRNIACYELHIDLTIPEKKLHRRTLNIERRDIVKEEIDKLLKAKHIAY